MKLKYYLKGLGTGILFASIILSISFAVYNRDLKKKTQDEIISAALDAGMVWPEAITPEETTPKETTPEDTTPKETTPEDTTPEETTPEDTTPEETTPEETTPEETTPEDTTPEEKPTGGEEMNTTVTSVEPESTTRYNLDECILYKGEDKATIKILKGMNSYDACKILEKAGVLNGYADRETFNDYLVAKGYANFILVGVFDIPANLSYEQIAAIICRTQQ